MPPTPDEIDAAAGRLRRLAAGESVYPDRSDYPHALASRADDQTLADAELAANPADDFSPRRPATQIGLMCAVLDYLNRTSDSVVDVPLGRVVLEAADAVLAELRRSEV